MRGLLGEPRLRTGVPLFTVNDGRAACLRLGHAAQYGGSSGVGRFPGEDAMHGSWVAIDSSQMPDAAGLWSGVSS
jgi:hypothetical protein